MIPSFATNFLSRKLIYALDMPSFQRDFASLKTLDHGTGPSITFTRASDATYFDADGVLQTAGTDAPRFDHDPATGASRGLLIEEARTNSIRNSQAGGSTNGVIGSGGVMPSSGWSITANANGVTSEIMGTGTETGFAYIDIKISGTPTATGSVFINFDGSTTVTAATGQTWTTSAYAKLAAGAVTNATCSLNIRGLDAAGVQVGTSTTANFTPTSSGLNTQRSLVTRALADVGVERVQGRALVGYTNGDPIDLTLRIAAPQLEQGAFATSYIPTTNAAATRAADSAFVTPIASFYNQAEGTIYNEFSMPVLDGANTLRGIVQFAEAAAIQNRLQTGVRGTGLYSFSAVAANSVEFEIVTSAGAVAAGTTVRAAHVYKSGDSARSFNGAAVGTSSAAITQPTRERLRLGDNGNILNGHIRKIAYWPKRLTNTLLEQLTT
jgi:hypothetical protein